MTSNGLRFSLISNWVVEFCFLFFSKKNSDSIYQKFCKMDFDILNIHQSNIDAILCTYFKALKRDILHMVNSKSTKWQLRNWKKNPEKSIHVFYCCHSPNKMASESYLYKIRTVPSFFHEKAKIRKHCWHRNYNNADCYCENWGKNSRRFPVSFILKSFWLFLKWNKTAVF